MAKFRATLVKWGNSVGVSLPKPIRDSMELKAGDEVEIIDKDDDIIIHKLLPKEKS
jgi:AbrB family looped-hinge helix DNA binding protein